MVKSFPLDYMHLICLGVVKKLIVSLWSGGKPPAKLPFCKLNNISISLLEQANNIPLEFNRKPRSLTESKRWKASEFRQFLLYTGPVVLKNILPDDKYQNFLSLHIAVTILSSSSKFLELIDYAHKLLHYFVETSIILYGQEHASHNIHNLLHITDDVKMFGPLDKFSAFSFENHMQILKKYVRKQDKPLQQLVKRKKELENLNIYYTKINSNAFHMVPNLISKDQFYQTYKYYLSMKQFPSETTKRHVFRSRRYSTSSEDELTCTNLQSTPLSHAPTFQKKNIATSTSIGKFH